MLLKRVFTDRIRSMGEGPVFTGVCHSFCPQGGRCVVWGISGLRAVGVWSEGVVCAWSEGVGVWSGGGCLV